MGVFPDGLLLRRPCALLESLPSAFELLVGKFAAGIALAENRKRPTIVALGIAAEECVDGIERDGDQETHPTEPQRPIPALKTPTRRHPVASAIVSGCSATASRFLYSDDRWHTWVRTFSSIRLIFPSVMLV